MLPFFHLKLIDLLDRSNSSDLIPHLYPINPSDQLDQSNPIVLDEYVYQLASTKSIDFITPF